MKEEDTLSDIIKYMNKNHGSINGLDKSSLLKTAANYFENIVAAEAQQETFKMIFKNIAG